MHTQSQFSMYRYGYPHTMNSFYRSPPPPHLPEPEKSTSEVRHYFKMSTWFSTVGYRQALCPTSVHLFGRFGTETPNYSCLVQCTHISHIIAYKINPKILSLNSTLERHSQGQRSRKRPSPWGCPAQESLSEMLVVQKLVLCSNHMLCIEKSELEKKRTVILDKLGD